MKRLFALTAILILILSALILIIRGHAADFGPTLDPGICDQPCWHGIQVGITPVKQAVTLLQREGIITAPRDFCALAWKTPQGWSGCLHGLEIETGASGTYPIFGLSLNSNGNTLPLGTIIAEFGTPLVVGRCWQTVNRANYAIPFATQITIALEFQGNLEVQISGPRTMFDDHFDATLPVQYVNYYAKSAEPPYRYDAPFWRGFRPFRDYRFDGC